MSAHSTLRSAYAFAVTKKNRLAYDVAKKLLHQKSDGSFCWNGFTVREHMGDDFYIGAALGFHRKFETMAAMAAHSADAPLILDVGAHVGMFSLCCSRIPNATIYGFEPVMGTYALNLCNMKANKADNVTSINMGLSDAEATLEIGPVAHDSHSTSRSVLRQDPADRKNVEIARFTTVDNFARDATLPRVDFVKIDVEGFEPRVLRGGMATFARHRPAVFFEFVTEYYARHGIDRGELARTMNELDYELFRASRRGWVRIPNGTLNDGAYNADFLMLPRGGRARLRENLHFVQGF